MSSTFQSTSASNITALRFSNYMATISTSFGRKAVPFFHGLTAAHLSSLPRYTNFNVVSSSTSKLSHSSRSSRALIATACLGDVIASRKLGVRPSYIMENLVAREFEYKNLVAYQINQINTVKSNTQTMRSQLSITGTAVAKGTYLLERKDQATMVWEKAVREGRRVGMRPVARAGPLEYICVQDMHPKDLKRFYWPQPVDEAELAEELGLFWYDAFLKSPPKLIHHGVAHDVEEDEEWCVETMIGF